MAKINTKKAWIRRDGNCEAKRWGSRTQKNLYCMCWGGKSAWKFNVGNCKATWSWQLEWKTNKKHQKNTEVLLDIWYWKKCWRHPKITKRCTLANELPNITLFMFFNCLTSPLPSPQKNITITKLRCFFQLKVLVRCLKGLSLLASSSFDFIGQSTSHLIYWSLCSRPVYYSFKKHLPTWTREPE